MQNPIGYEMAVNGNKVIMTDFFALLTNRYVGYMLVHTLLSAYLLTAFLIMGICASHFLKRNNNEVFKKSFSIAVTIALTTASCFQFLVTVMHNMLPSFSLLKERQWMRYGKQVPQCPCS
jgi:cytochrome bd-type quinol oxidase subunit 1